MLGEMSQGASRCVSPGAPRDDGLRPGNARDRRLRADEAAAANVAAETPGDIGDATPSTAARTTGATGV